VVAVSEGICDKNGTAIAAKLSKEVDSHGNVQLSGSGALGDLLAGIVKRKTKISRVRADTFGYLQRSFPDIASSVDSAEAREVGKLAVKHAVAGKTQSGSVTINRKSGKKYAPAYGLVELRQVSKETRHMPDKFINKDANDVTPAFIAYAKPLVGKLPVIGRFKGVRVKKVR
jgi:6-phosphofructokinase 1